jgi:hypothetical protein
MRFLLSIAIALLGLVLALSPVRAKELTLQDLLDGATVMIDDVEFLHFRDFRSETSGGAHPANPGQILIVPQHDPLRLELRFLGGSEFFADVGQSQTTSFDYDVRTISGKDLLRANALTLTQFALREPLSGGIVLTEGVADTLGHFFGEKLVFASLFNQQLFDDLAFAPQGHLIIRTKIGVEGGAVIGEWRQDFSPVPEPAACFLIATGLLVLFYADGRKRKLHGS